MDNFFKLAFELGKKVGIDFDSDTLLDKLELYYDFLIHWNKITNLTRITEEEDVYVKHFLDSWTCLHLWNKDWKKAYDVGSGAGFPGVPLALVLPETHFTLIDSHEKKCLFLEDLVSQLQLNNVDVVCNRCENLEPKDGDVVLTRAVSRIDTILEISCRILKVNGHNLLMRGENYQNEVFHSKEMERFLNYELEKTLEIKRPKGRFTALALYRYLKEADMKYPRRYSKIKRFN